MTLGDGIRKLGFRKWYERALIHSHLYLLMAILCTVGLLSVFEVFSRARGADRAFDLMALVLFTVVGALSLRRYLYLLMHAENTAHQAVCSKCQSYGYLQIEHEDAHGHRLHVRCKRCQHRWPITED
jgi:ABC-type nickel/cobalt efflux system permease component RcnA